MFDIIETIILGFVSYLIFFKTEFLVKLFDGDITGQKMEKSKRDIRKNLGIISLISFIFFLLKVIYVIFC